jgi:hypothetical protein
LTPRENLILYAHLYGIHPAIHHNLVENILIATLLLPQPLPQLSASSTGSTQQAILGSNYSVSSVHYAKVGSKWTKPLADTPCERLTPGQLRLVMIAIALLDSDVELTLLDEFSINLDPGVRQKIDTLLRNVSGTRTFLVTSHIMEEIELLADSCAIMNEGCLIAVGNKGSLKQNQNDNFYGKKHTKTEDGGRGFLFESSHLVNNDDNSDLPPSFDDDDDDDDDRNTHDLNDYDNINHFGNSLIQSHGFGLHQRGNGKYYQGDGSGGKNRGNFDQNELCPNTGELESSKPLHDELDKATYTVNIRIASATKTIPVLLVLLSVLANIPPPEFETLKSLHKNKIIHNPNQNPNQNSKKFDSSSFDMYNLLQDYYDKRDALKSRNHNRYLDFVARAHNIGVFLISPKPSLHILNNYNRNINIQNDDKERFTNNLILKVKIGLYPLSALFSLLQVAKTQCGGDLISYTASQPNMSQLFFEAIRQADKAKRRE